MRRYLPLLLLLVLVFGCSRTYYSAMEKIGYHKRDILVKRVTAATESQQEVQEQFKSALEKFTAVVKVDGGDLQTRYEALQEEFDESERRANELRGRIDAVEKVAEDLFDEWEDELEEYSNASLRSTSKRQLEDTRKRYTPMIRAMRRAEKTMDPVLDAFRDQVLFLKHNLNARAIASIKGELVEVETNVGRLITDMEASISEAQRFIATMEQG